MSDLDVLAEVNNALVPVGVLLASLYPGALDPEVMQDAQEGYAIAVSLLRSLVESSAPPRLDVVDNGE